MSHFLTLVILPKRTAISKIEAKTAQLLQPYDVNTQVPLYETACMCVGIQARVEVEAEVTEQYDIKQLREEYQNLPEEQQTEEKLAELLNPCFELRQELLEAHPLKDKPNPTCECCEGTGKRTTQFNPAAKWDWWVIGGRWDGWIHGPVRQEASCDKKAGYNFGNEHHRPENNCRRVSEIPIDDPFYLPFAVVTPDSQWIEQGEMGMWAIVMNAVGDEQWHQTVKEILAKYPDHLVVAVDCHI